MLSPTSITVSVSAAHREPFEATLHEAHFEGPDCLALARNHLWDLGSVIRRKYGDGDDAAVIVTSRLPGMVEFSMTHHVGAWGRDSDVMKHLLGYLVMTSSGPSPFTKTSPEEARAALATVLGQPVDVEALPEGEVHDRLSQARRFSEAILEYGYTSASLAVRHERLQWQRFKQQLAADRAEAEACEAMRVMLKDVREEFLLSQSPKPSAKDLTSRDPQRLRRFVDDCDRQIEFCQANEVSYWFVEGVRAQAAKDLASLESCPLPHIDRDHPIKATLVTGRTYPVRHELRAQGAQWCPEMDGYLLPGDPGPAPAGCEARSVVVPHAYLHPDKQRRGEMAQHRLHGLVERLGRQAEVLEKKIAAIKRSLPSDDVLHDINYWSQPVYAGHSGMEAFARRREKLRKKLFSMHQLERDLDALRQRLAAKRGLVAPVPA